MKMVAPSNEGQRQTSRNSESDQVTSSQPSLGYKVSSKGHRRGGSSHSLATAQLEGHTSRQLYRAMGPIETLIDCYAPGFDRV